MVHPEDIPDNILAKKPGDCMFVVRFCGSRDFCWTYHGRVLPYSDDDLEMRSHHKKPKATDNYKKGTSCCPLMWEDRGMGGGWLLLLL